MSYHSTKVQVTVGEDFVTLTAASGQIVLASIVYAERDTEGNLTYAMLDRHVHSEYVDYYPWVMSGCFATEIRHEPIEDT